MRRRGNVFTASISQCVRLSVCTALTFESLGLERSSFGMRDIFGMVGCVAQLAERRSLSGELTLSYARPSADGDHYVGKPSATGQPTRLTQPFIPPGSINEQQA